MNNCIKLSEVLLSANPKSVLEKKLLERPIELDLSDFNTELAQYKILKTEVLQGYIELQIRKQKGTLGIGGYLEQRRRYSDSDVFRNTEEPRSVHLGIDLWAAAGTNIYAPFESLVHSFQDNSNHLDYGPTVILEHTIDGLLFHTLYGHLSRQSLEGLSIGKKLVAGELIGVLGREDENGGWPPHLHFQIIEDLNGNFGDYPGVATKKEVYFYKNNCPDPNLILKL